MGLARLIYTLLVFYEAILIVRIILTWIKQDRYHPVFQYVYKVTDPVLEPVRRLIPIQGFGFDFSPIIVFLIIEFLKRIFLRGAYIGY